MTDNTFAHNLELPDLQTRLKDVVSNVKREFGGMIADFTEKWNATSGTIGFTLMGRNISVTFESDEEELRVESDDLSGQVLRIIAPKIKEAIQ
jgi:hypothetical protein